MKTKLLTAVLAAPLLCAGPSASFAEQAETYRIAVSTYLSGAGAVFGVPAQQAAEIVAEKINADGGIKGAKVELTFIEEAKGVDNVVSEIRQLAEGDAVDAMIIGLSSSICLAAAPVIEGLEMPTVFWDCGTSRIYEESSYDYIYRTADYTPQTNVASALYLLKTRPDVKTIAAINPDYSFGRDNWEAFKTAVEALKPDVEFVAELFPKLGTADYSTEVSRLASLRADVVFSTLWGGDMNTFIRQASSRGLFNTTQLVAPNGGASIEQLGLSFPEGSIVGVRGDSWAINPAMADNGEHQWFIDTMKERTGAFPAFPSYQMAQAMMAIKTSLEANWDGAEETKQSALLAGLEGLELDDFSGKLRLREDHQSVEDQLVGTTVKTTWPFMDFENVAIIPGDLITPPVGEKSIPWIKTLDPGLLGEITVAGK